MHNVEREIISITNYKVQRKFSDRQDYLKSLFNAIQKLGNDEFDELSDDAAIWANSCVEAYNSNKDGDLPDFDEMGYQDEDDEGTISEESDNEDELVEAKSPGVKDDNNTSGNSEDIDETEEEDGPEPELENDEDEVNPPKRSSKKVAKPTKVKSKKTPLKIIKKKTDDEEVELDKWGCMVGSKNGRALAAFEKGATAKEIKETFGGTYYNILKRMVSHGHKLEKKGSVIKLTHMTEKPSRVSAPKRSKQ